MTDELDKHLSLVFEEGRCRKQPEKHPAPEKLSAYEANELPPEEADNIQEHLIQCSFCTDLLLALQCFLEPSEEDCAWEGVSDLGTEAGWRRVHKEMGWQKPPVEVSRVRRRLRILQAVAAALLVGVTGLSVYVVHLHENLEVPPQVFLTTPLSNYAGVR